MAALDIRLPGPATFLLEQLLVRLAELAEIGVTRDNHLIGNDRITPRIDLNEVMDQSSIDGFLGDRLCWVESRKIKKLSRGAGHDDAMKGIAGLGLVPAGGPYAVAVVIVLPNQFVRVSKRVLSKIETSP
jgi:hypothetical protein